MKRVYIDNNNSLNNKMIRNCSDINLVDCASDSDIIISQSTINYKDLINKTIYVAAEPPRTSHRLWCYSNFDECLLVVCYNPDSDKPNQIPFTPDDSPQYYPTKPDAYVQMEKQRNFNRSVFYAGRTNPNELISDRLGGHNIQPLRQIIGDYIIEELPGSRFIGIGWGDQNSKVKFWRKDKQDQIEESGCGFVLALENTIYPNYISEKIWDGINSDRVTLYLGDPNIENHIPLNCFIDLRPYYDKTCKKFDNEGVVRRIKEITVDEYNDILGNAREFRKTSVGKYQYYMDLLTKKLINFIIEY